MCRFIPAHAGNRSCRTPPSRRCAVHPRARGEQIPTSRQSTSCCGSSPRTRGTERRARSVPAQQRFIPAHAGNSRLCGDCSCSAAVHPRARGEQLVLTGSLSADHGSSPRTRGTAPRNGCGPLHGRFIPAHAGNSERDKKESTAQAVHPRARGEQCPTGSPRTRKGGSSPRTRGTAPGLDVGLALLRFIPAHAGNSQSRCAGVPGSSVHPRARGEQGRNPQVRCRARGSSPRTRGTGKSVTLGPPGRRFIPAHAGNSRTRRSRRPNRPVHPRARGEQRAALPQDPCHSGSSPRTRGTATWRCLTSGSRRFIPAHAGNSSGGARAVSRPAVHPRARGEQPQACQIGGACFGSSPRTRGTDPPPPRRTSGRRFIPAHAGNRRPSESAFGSTPVHPRARGEQSSGSTPSMSAYGSSPRTRGTVYGLQKLRVLQRFIPAHAGNR